MRNYILAFVLFIVLVLSKVVIANEYTVDANQIKQLLCNILKQKNISAYLKEMGTVEEDRESENKVSSRKTSTSYILKVRTETHLFVYRHRHSVFANDPSRNEHKESLAIVALNKKQIFKSKSEAKNWLAPFGATIYEDEGDICVGDDRYKDDDGEIFYRWNVSVNCESFCGVSVVWNRNNNHVDRFCR